MRGPEIKNESMMVWYEPPSDKPTKVIIYSPQEPCPVPAIIFGTVANEGRKVGNVFSKLLNVKPLQQAFNDDDLVNIYETKDSDAVLISINGLHQISHENSNHWLFGYPIVRDALISTLIRYRNITEVVFATTDMYSDFRWKEDAFADEPACRLYESEEIPEQLTIPMFVYAGLYICKAYDLRSMVMCFSASVETPLIKAAFADGVGLLPFMNLKIDLDNAKELYDEWEAATKEAEGMVAEILKRAKNDYKGIAYE